MDNNGHGHKWAGQQMKQNEKSENEEFENPKRRKKCEFLRSP